MKTPLLLVWMALSLPLWGQNVFVAGPVVGGVTDTSARLFIRTDSLRSFELQLATDSLFGSFTTLLDSTRADRYRCRIVDVAGLQPNTRYHYRFVAAGDTVRGRFRSFPAQGQPATFRMAVGSCGYVYNPSVYQQIVDFDPHLFLHLGDWGFAPSSMPYGWQHLLYPHLHADAFQYRYTLQNEREFLLPNMAFDYVYDDDFSQNSVEGDTWSSWSTTTDSTGMAVNSYVINPMDSMIRRNAYRAYYTYFPAYPPVDSTKGIYHNIRIGNTELFMLDTRNTRANSLLSLVPDSTGLYRFQPPAGHSLLGPSCRQWLFDGLKNSPARWKLVGSGVMFNKRFRDYIYLLEPLQLLPITVNGQPSSVGLYMASLLYNWAGYPYDQDSLIALVDQHQIEGVVVLSGDSHSSMIDDGTNAGLPELSASGLAANDEGYLNSTIDPYLGLFGYPPVAVGLWNRGGNGVGNTNRLDTWGSVEVFGNDSLRLRVFDETGLMLASLTLPQLSGRPTPAPQRPFSLYPNPATHHLNLRWGSHTPAATDRLQLLGPNGQVLAQWNQLHLLGNQPRLNLPPLPMGLYSLVLHSARGPHSQWVLVNP